MPTVIFITIVYKEILPVMFIKSPTEEQIGGLLFLLAAVINNGCVWIEPMELVLGIIIQIGMLIFPPALLVTLHDPLMEVIPSILV